MKRKHASPAALVFTLVICTVFSGTVYGQALTKDDAFKDLQSRDFEAFTLKYVDPVDLVGAKDGAAINADKDHVYWSDNAMWSRLRIAEHTSKDREEVAKAPWLLSSKWLKALEDPNSGVLLFALWGIQDGKYKMPAASGYAAFATTVKKDHARFLNLVKHYPFLSITKDEEVKLLGYPLTPNTRQLEQEISKTFPLKLIQAF